MTRIAHCVLWIGLLCAASAARADSLEAPQVLLSPAAVYPPGHHEDATVVLLITVDVEGKPREPQIVASGGPDFDAAALAALGAWKFRPALKDGAPFPARVRIPFIFQAPPAAAPGSPNSNRVDSDAGTKEALAPAAPAQAPLPVVPITPLAGVPPAEIADAGAPAAANPDIEEVIVRGEQEKPDRGGSDFEIKVGVLSVISGQSVEDLLQLAPGIFITNEGGMGHADQVFLRGFDAETGAGIEFTVNGVPINEVDNTDGHGYADTHFIIPEVVKELRVIEGPFDPHQGDFAQGGSVDYELGVSERRLQVSTALGSFGTERALALWAPQGERDGTFAAVQAETTKGFGQNRAGTDASMMGQYEGELGQRGLWRAMVTAYATQYQSAGAVRADDVASGTIGFYGTEDPSQGGSAQRYTASFSLVNPVEEGLFSFQLFATDRALVLDEDFTGFLLDPITAGQTPHGQRGDGILQNYHADTLGSRGSYKLTRNWLGEDQSLELGYYARYDHTTPSIDRVRFGTQIPYLVDEDMVTDVFNIAGYADLDIHLGKRLTLRGGFRQEYFNYDLENLCAASANYISGGSIGQGLLPNVACPAFDSAGPRLPNQQTTAAGLTTEPKATALFQITPALTATASFGVGAASQDATQISQGEQTPFTQLDAAEAGVKVHHRFDDFEVSSRLLGYYTHTSAALYFNPNLGRLTPTGPTERGGGVFDMRLAGRWFDEQASATYAYAIYDSDGTLVPYIPNLVARSNTVFFHDLPWRLDDRPLIGKAGIGLNYVGERALPLGQFASPTFVMNASARLRWSFLELGIEAENLLNKQHALSEFYYASYFPHGSGGQVTYPTYAPAPSFTAAPPLTVMVTLSLIFGQENDR